MIAHAAVGEDEPAIVGEQAEDLSGRGDPGDGFEFGFERADGPGGGDAAFGCEGGLGGRSAGVGGGDGDEDGDVWGGEVGHVREGLVMNCVGIFGLLSELSLRGGLRPGFWVRVSGIEKLA